MDVTGRSACHYASGLVRSSGGVLVIHVNVREEKETEEDKWRSELQLRGHRHRTAREVIG